MNRRRLVLTTVLLGFVGATAAPVLAAPSTSKPPRDDVCVVLAMDDHGDTTKDFCVTFPSPV